MPAFQLIALTPPGSTDPAVAIAASRAGFLGVLNLEYIKEVETARQAVTRLITYTNGNCGIKFDSRASTLIKAVTEDKKLAKRVGLLIFTPWHPENLSRQVPVLQQRGFFVLLEIHRAAQIEVARELGVDGLIAKGNEAGGWVGEETTFILLQQLLSKSDLPVWASGGIGLHTAAACYAAGAAGAVLEGQLALTRESGLLSPLKNRIAAMDGSETVCLGSDLDLPCRIYGEPGQKRIEALQSQEQKLVDSAGSLSRKQAAWRTLISEAFVRPGSDKIFPLGQDAAFAGPLARRFVTVSGVLSAIQEAIAAHARTAAALRPLDQEAPLARSHQTRYPIVQGPMTRVSDKAAFAHEVARAGGLPFLALALMRQSQVGPLLEETGQLLGDRPWGVGILGFVSPEVRQEQLAAIRKVRPGFALIAGGRPDQALLLEQAGIPTYLHVPSPALLNLFLAQGSRRFVFEGRECGGHVGPRSSFVLWELMIEILLDHLAAARDEARDFHILFAGGIHDARSAAMVATLAAPLAELGVRLGVLMGTAYLYTQEAVKTGAILPGYQAEALRHDRTVLLEAGPGYATRCLATPYSQTFAEKKRQLLREKAPPTRLRDELETLNLGRLRLASKGIIRNPNPTKAEKYLAVDEAGQQQQGMYMIGQVSGLRDQVVTLQALHRDVSRGGSDRLAALLESDKRSPVRQHESQAAQIAIVGMACILPQAASLRSFWENILDKVDAITEVPQARWDWRRYFDPDQTVRDKIYSRWGGFIDDIPLNPTDYGMPPNSLSSIEPVQLLMLEITRAALADAGYLDRPFPRDRTSVIVGVGGGLGDLGYQYGFRAYLPHLLDSESSEVITALADRLPEWNEDSFPGILLNVVAGRISNRFDLGGPNFVVDAACGSSLAALDVAVKYLETHQTDMALVGAADTVQSPFAYLAFSKTQALSASGRCRPFDASADGIAISEGLSMVVLKRLADAERDGDRIYAVIQGLGASSDGRDKGLTAPRPAGQRRALRRAYAKAGIPADTVGLIEAHGTGTRVGDPVEVEALADFFQSFQAKRQTCALGSVKSLIGHTKSTAGLAGLIKAALALHQKVLPPTLVDQPNPKINFPETPFYVNNQARPWLKESAEQVRRAGVSAFGFGGTNFHAVLEEYRHDYLPSSASRQNWPAELLLWHSHSQAGLADQIDTLLAWLSDGNEPPLRDLAYALYLAYRQADGTGPALALVAPSLDDLKQKLAQVKAKLDAGEAAIDDPRGIYFTDRRRETAEIAFLFPGQGAQYPNMLRDLALQFPQVRAHFEEANQILHERLPRPLSHYVFPIPTYTEEASQAARDALTATRIAQPALGAAGLALSSLLQELGIQPKAVAGHSYGELVALCQAGVISRADLLLLSETRGRFMAEAAGPEAGTMAAVRADRKTVAAAIQGIEDLTMANLNAPTQTVISGPQVAIEQALEALQPRGISARVLPVACAFHSPLVAPAGKRLARFLETIEFRPPVIDLFSNTTGDLYSHEPETIRELLSKQLVRPVEFQKEIEAMYEAGIRIFVETGPGRILSSLVDQILGEKPHLAVPVDQPAGAGLVTLQKALAQLAVAGVPLALEPLYEGRAVTALDFGRPYQSPLQSRYGPTTWLVNGSRARPWRDSQEQVPELPPQPLKVTLSERTKSTQKKGEERPTRDEGNVPVAGDFSETPSPPLSSSPPSNGNRAQTAAGDGARQVLSQYQRLMSQFLETQKEIMLAYLAGAPASAVEKPSRQDQEPGSEPEPPADPPISSAPVPPAAPESTQQPPAEKSPPPEATPAGPARNGRTFSLDRTALTQELLTLVSERTGYPAEMLDLEANLEADLGIDSIKRVEILGAFGQRQPHLEPLLTGEKMEQLQTQQSLGAIVECVLSQTEAKEEPPLPAVTEQEIPEPATPSPETGPIERFRLVSTETPLTGLPGSLAPGRVILIVPDNGGIGQSVAERLRAQKHPVVLLANSRHTPKTGPDFFSADLTDPNALDEVLNQIRTAYGPVAGLLHLASLSSEQEFEPGLFSSWSGSFQQITSLFCLVKALQTDLISSAQAGGACLLAATGMGGGFASDTGGDISPFFPGQGGLVGLLKTVALEWPTVRVKAVDLNLGQGSSLAVEAILQELTADDGLVEVGYNGSFRQTLHMVPASPDETAPAALPLDSRSVILMTGGARGITAQIARDLAARYQSVLLLVGRSPRPAPEESSQTAGLISKTAIKKALIATLSTDGDRPELADVESAYQALMREREIRANLAAIRQAGATVHYYQTDVRNETKFGALIDDIYETHDRLDGVIHGAGIIEDKLIENKSLESFKRVIRTKVDSAFTLGRKVRPESLQFLVLFSSISSRFGNKGQSDYAAANEVLNKLAIYLDRRLPARVVSLNWGPWEGAGMVSSELGQAFSRRGVRLIPPALGQDMLIMELQSGRKGEAEIIICGEDAKVMAKP